ncbi:MAG TPA: DNA polymerase I [Spirochaetia bacterium]|nr:DNA polymerase I [Spirochaetia bacterium]
MDNESALYLLDGYGLIFRSYFAFIRSPLRNPDGKNISATFGFFRTLLMILKDRKPGMLVVALDSKTPTHRHEHYKEYKATREKSPDDLREQIPVIEEILDVLGVPAIRVDGYEADDIIATYAERCRRENRQCYVISSDKDLLQLVDGPVRVLKPADGGFQELDRERVLADWGVYPEQIRDYLSLVGDSADNIPGVKGVGAKSAVALLTEFGNLAGIYEHLEDVASKSWREKLEQGRDDAKLSYELIGLHTEVPVGREIADLTLGDLNREAAAAYFLREGIKSIAAELGAKAAGKTDSSEGAAETVASAAGTVAAVAGSERPSSAARGTYSTVRTLAELDEWVARVKKAGWFAFDSETSGIDAVSAEPYGFSLCIEEGKACYIPLVGPDGEVFEAEEVRKRLRVILEDPKLFIIGQNVKYDYKVLKRWGVTMANIAFDTMIAAWLLDTTANIYNMDRLAEVYLGYNTIHFRDVIEEVAEGEDETDLKVTRGGRILEGPTFDRVPLEKATEYAAEDADVTFRLYSCFKPLLAERGMWELFTSLEMPLVRILGDLELAGMRLDTDRLAAFSHELSGELKQIELKIYELCGKTFNIASTRQLQEVLFTDRKLRPGKKTKTGYSTDNDVLVELSREDPVPELVLKYRMLSKLKSTYVDALPRMVNERTGRVHTSLHQTGTATGRLSSKDPNLQNIPIRDEEGRRIREAFIPDPGNRFVSADYSQIELVVLAHLSGDPGLGAAFRSGQDVHRQTGALIFGVEPESVSDDQRRVAKTINFGVMYGMSAFRLSRELGIPRADADKFIEAYFATYSRIKGFIEEIVHDAEQNGYVKTLMGRQRPIPTITSRNRTEKMAAERIAVNTPIQGSAADIVKLAMIHVDARLRREKLSARLILQVHDELIIECPEKEVGKVEKLLEEEMVSVMALAVPLKVHVESGGSWGELH